MSATSHAIQCAIWKLAFIHCSGDPNLQTMQISTTYNAFYIRMFQTCMHYTLLLMCLITIFGPIQFRSSQHIHKQTNKRAKKKTKLQQTMRYDIQILYTQLCIRLCNAIFEHQALLFWRCAVQANVDRGCVDVCVRVCKFFEKRAETDFAQPLIFCARECV